MSKTIHNEGTDTRWRNKGHAHERSDKAQPKVCTNCNGVGKITLKNYITICHKCMGTGEEVL